MKEFKHKCELKLLMCEPNPLRPDRVTIGFILRDMNPESNRVEVRLARDLRPIQCIYPAVDLDAIQGTLEDMRSIMENVADFEQYLQNLPSDFPVDLSLMPKGAVLTESMESEVNLLEDQYLKRMKLAKVDRASTSDSEIGNSEIGNSETENSQSEKNDSGRESTSVQGRAYIRRRMQESFVHFGLWDFLHKEISIESYTFKGDPLKIDFGYLNPAANTFRMLHAVSLTMNLNQTRNFGLSWEPIRDGFNKGKNQTAEMIAVVEAENLCQSEVARSARSWMERNGILVRPVTEMMNIAAEARAELRL